MLSFHGQHVTVSRQVQVWGAGPLICPCCKSTVKVAGTMVR